MLSKVKRVLQLARKVPQIHYVSCYRDEYVKHTVRKDTVLIESTHGDAFYGHMYYLTRDMHTQYPNLKINLAMRPERIKSTESQLEQMGLSDVHVIPYLGKEYCILLASAEYLFNDTSFYGFFIKQPFQHYVNIWHGTPLKCLGKDDGDVRNMGNVQKNFYTADKLIVTNDYTRQAMIQSFNLEGVMRGKVVVAPSPRNSVLHNQDVRMHVRQRYGIGDREALVYMPTWRGGVSAVDNKSGEITHQLQSMDKRLNDNQILYVKLHPFQAKLEQIDFTPYKHIQQFPDDVESYEFLTGTDGLITDYSSIMYDYMNTGKPVVLYVYDKDEYYAERGCYEDIDDYPFPKFHSLEGLGDWIENGSRDATYGAEFSSRFIGADNINGSQQVTQYAIESTKDFGDVQIDEYIPYNGKETVVIMTGKMVMNGITSALINTLDTVDVTKRNYVVYVKRNMVDEITKERLLALPAGVQFYTSAALTANNLFERVAGVLYRKFEKIGAMFERTADASYAREFERLFGALKPSSLIHYTGYERAFAEMICAIRDKDVKTSIYMHNDMVVEHAKKASKLNWRILTRAYHYADNVVFVSTAQKDTFLKTFPEIADSAKVVDNFIGSKQVRQKSEVPVADTLIDVPIVNNNGEEIEAGELGRVKQQLINDLGNPKLKIFINIGRLAAQKSQDRLIAGFIPVHEQYPDTRLVIVGSYGDKQKQIVDAIAQSGCADSICLIGGMPNPYALLAQTDAFVFTSLYEGLGLVVFEALAVGTDVITVNIPETVAMLDEGNAKVVPNSQKGITTGWLEYMRNGYAKTDFDFQKWDEKSKTEFDELFI
ncbi:CDP-glycerol glycerophosphotransferase family protein [Lacticaseibacillus hulanensis]|uniref:CDP-glycerol glycerophosphotransferase family protein n=1 Tax=Lacticaseibacillus hulanensis TaxID=2493111 RepID=UPI000FD92BFE|nr:CDP-glycerol glycerophosphotransferase family protein [Lacticaseibacillus hulanensis]